MEKIPIHNLFKDKDSLNTLISFLNKEDSLSFLKISESFNIILRHLPFKQVIVGWTTDFKLVKNIIIHGEILEDLTIEDTFWMENLLLNFPKLKKLSLINYRRDNHNIEKQLNKYRKRNVEIKILA